MKTTTRRALMMQFGLAGVGLGVAGLASESNPPTPDSNSVMPPLPPGANGRRLWYNLDVVRDPLMDDKLLWYLSHTAQDMADVGEVLETGTRIDSNPSWYPAWLETADRVRGYGEDCQKRRHEVSAGKAYFRAANYYRAALIHHVPVNEADSRRTAELAQECFEKATQLLKLSVRPVKIPYEHTSLPAYFIRSPRAASKAPTIILHQGLDAWPEESWWAAAAALDRGYHVVLLHGPGQGLALWRQGLYFRPDWEKVVTPAVDFVFAEPGVDRGRIILFGESFGGYLAPRAAAFEPRLRACVANPGVLNWYDSIAAHFPPEVMALVDSSPDKLNAYFQDLYRKRPGLEFTSKDIRLRYGAVTPADMFKALRQYNNEPYAQQIKCETLIMDGDGEVYMKGQSRKLYDALTCPKDFMHFTAQDTGLLHCQNGATLLASQRLFDWLDEHVA
jgi:alpha-beta hydrolase superfamily lysophospholipase